MIKIIKHKRKETDIRFKKIQKHFDLSLTEQDD